MIDQKRYTELLQWHNGIEYFDYDNAIDWAIELIKSGKESENILIVASFSKPVDREEIKPYITGALKELNLIEKYGDYALIANAHYHLEQILIDYKIRLNLRRLYRICVNADMDHRLMPFYLLYSGWSELEEIGVNYYFEGADLDNIEEVTKDQARIWIDKYVHGIETIEKNEKKEVSLTTYKVKAKEKKNKQSLWQSIKSIFK